MSTLQIQTVLFKNEKWAIVRSLESIKIALAVANSTGTKFSEAKVCYGDASPERLFSDEEILELNRKYENFFSVEYTYFNRNTGTSMGHNLLAKNSKMEYLILMNPDIIFSPKFLVNVIRPFKDAKLNAGIVEARQTPIEHPKEYNTKTGETSWSSGACSVIRSSVFWEVGGYDEKNFFMYCDDVDLSWRVRLFLGKKVIYQPQAVVFHAKRLSSRGKWQPTSAEAYYSAEAALLMAYKWSNDRLLSSLLANFQLSKDKNLLKAVENFKIKKEKNLLPERLDKNHKVANFLPDGNYSKNRFII